LVSPKPRRFRLREAPEGAVGGRNMLGQIVRMVIRMSAGVVTGTAPGALYASLIGAVHLSVYGSWDRVPAFIVGCILVGALVGLLGSIRWALSGKAAPDSVPAAPAGPVPVATGRRPPRPRRPGPHPRGNSRGCARDHRDLAAASPVLDRRRWLAERDPRWHRGDCRR
jgi:hypothetical protein